MDQNRSVYISHRNKINVSFILHECGQRFVPSGGTLSVPWSDTFRLWYVAEGKGEFDLPCGRREIAANASFLLFPGDICAVNATSTAPLRMLYIGFSGYLAREYLLRAGYSPEKPVFLCEDDPFYRDCFEKLYAISQRWHNRYCGMLSLLYGLIGRQIDIAASDWRIVERYGSDFYIRRALEYIDMQYEKPELRIEDVAKYAGITRKYFYHVFQQVMRQSPQQYLIRYRMRKAEELLRTRKLSVTELARAVGYSDPFHFSKVFKSVYGAPPSRYVQTLKNPEGALDDARERLAVMHRQLLALQTENSMLREQIEHAHAAKRP